MTSRRNGRVYLSIPNLWVLCALFLGTVTVHSAISVPVIVNRTESALGQALEASIENQNKIMARLEERFDRIEKILQHE